MATFLSAYIVVWLGVAAFVVRLGIRQRRLQQTIDELSDAIEPSSSSSIEDELNQAPMKRPRAA